MANEQYMGGNSFTVQISLVGVGHSGVQLN